MKFNYFCIGFLFAVIGEKLKYGDISVGSLLPLIVILTLVGIGTILQERCKYEYETLPH